MTSVEATSSSRKRSRTGLIALLLTATLSGASVVAALTWSASATEPSTNGVANATAEVNMDSLYAAKASEEVATDTSYAMAIPASQTLSGRVSWYGPGFHGRRTANGERFNKHEMTAAHKTLPFGTLVRVVNEKSGRSVLVRINDRGPYCGGRVLDLSEGAAGRVGIKGSGTGAVKMEVYASKGASAIRAFDAEGRSIRLHGRTVSLAGQSDFDEAITLQQRLIEQGYDNVFIVETRQGDSRKYSVSVGLFSSDALAKSLLIELTGQYASAEIVQFTKGLPTNQQLAQKQADSAANS
ncbi:MAG: septal ring lytic transglycosylase RlpA family protein [Chlorobi bacterium]|nr:septal ring lytic transglycosylase RlpA family protein [Chlorobiota bacterium]